MNKPFFSIIVAAFNAQETIKRTVESVLFQDFADYEIIVKDGASKDDTLKQIPMSDKIHVYSNSDGGIYQGMNEGIEYANGRYLCFLNCGDEFYDESVLRKMYEVANELSDDRNILYGNYIRKGVEFKQPSYISSFYLYRTPLCHQSMFFGKTLMDEIGGYDTNYKILADYNCTLRAFKAGVPFVYCDYAVCAYLGGGASETVKGIKIKNEEYKRIRSTYYKTSEIVKNDIKIFLTFKKLRQILISDKSPEWIRRLYRKIVNKTNH